MAYLLLGALTVIAAQPTLEAHRLALAIVTYADLLELGELFIPNRVVSVWDFLANATGVILGVLITTLTLRWLEQRRLLQNVDGVREVGKL